MTVMISSSNKSWASRGLNWYITKSLECPKSLTNCLKIKKLYHFWKASFVKISYMLSENSLLLYMLQKKDAKHENSPNVLSMLDFIRNLRQFFWPF